MAAPPKPFRFWLPYLRLIEVGWNAADLLVLTLDFGRHERAETAGAMVIHLANNESGVQGEMLNGNLGGQVINPPLIPPFPVPPPVVKVFSYQKVEVHTQETETIVYERVIIGRYNISTSRGTITFYDDALQGEMVPFIVNWDNPGAGGAVPPDVVEDYMQYVVEQVFPSLPTSYSINLIEVLESEMVVEERTEHDTNFFRAYFLDLPKIKADLGPEPGVLSLPLTIGATPATVSYGLAFGASIWKGNRRFPLVISDEGFGGLDPEGQPYVSAVETISSNPEQETGPKTIIMHIDLEADPYTITPEVVE